MQPAPVSMRWIIHRRRSSCYGGLPVEPTTSASLIPMVFPPVDNVEDWPRRPDRPVSADDRTFAERSRSLVVDLYQRRWLSAAILTIRDRTDIPWRALLDLDGETIRGHHFAELDDAEFSYRHCLSLHIGAEFPLDFLYRIQSDFPAAELHLPPLIVQRGRCHSPIIDKASELAVIVD